MRPQEATRTPIGKSGSTAVAAPTGPTPRPGPSTPVAPRPPQPNVHATQLTFLRDALGKAVQLHLMDGSHLHGELLEHDQFSLLVWPDGAGSPTLVYKHAVCWFAVVDQRS